MTKKLGQGAFTLTFQGKRLTLRQWSIVTGVKWHTLYTRAVKGLSAEQILAKSPLKSGTRPSIVTAFGEALTLKQWSERNGVDAIRIYNRLRKGWAAEDAVTPGPQPKQERKPRPPQAPEQTEQARKMLQTRRSNRERKDREEAQQWIKQDEIFARNYMTKFIAKKAE